MPAGNVLFITVDQLSARVLDGPLGALIATPNLDRLRASATSFRKHFTVTVPCGPARASLLTGLYAMNHRSIRNGTPLAAHHATLATEARRAGYEPLLFGYTDTSIDPTGRDPADPALRSYEGVAPGFSQITEMHFDSGSEWPAYLKEQGYAFEHDHAAPVSDIFRPVSQADEAPRVTNPALYRAEHSDTAYLTDRTLAALEIRRGAPWFAHVSYIRPHPPLVAPAPYNRLVDPASVPLAPRDRPDHPFLDAWFSQAAKQSLFWGFHGDCSRIGPELERAMVAVYLGLLAELDHHLGRILDWLEESGQARETLLILTADHGEMLGDKGLWGKDAVFDPAFHVPLFLRDPRDGLAGHVVETLTESIDLMPTILAWIGQAAPEALDGRSLLALAAGETPGDWRDAVLMEAEFGEPHKPTRFTEHLGLEADQAGVAVLREAGWKYVHFNGGVAPMLFNLAEDPGETTDLAPDPAQGGQLARLRGRLLDRMMSRRDRRLTQISLGG